MNPAAKHVAAWPTRGTDAAIRVVTWNLWWRFGNWRQRLDAIGEVLANAEPDICGLQEIWADDGQNSAELLADRLDMYCAWVPSPRPERWRHRIGQSNTDICNAVLSRWPITQTDHMMLPAEGHDEGRTAVVAAVSSPAGCIAFFTTQLSSAPDQSAVRCRQVAALAAFVAAHRTTEFPPVLTGDFNAQPASDEIRLIEGHLTAPAVPGLVLVDAWRYADPPADGLTWNRANPHVAATLEPSARIDFIFVGLPHQSGRGHVRSVRLIGSQPVGDIWPSDHAGVLAELDPGPANLGDSR